MEPLRAIREKPECRQRLTEATLLNTPLSRGTNRRLMTLIGETSLLRDTSKRVAGASHQDFGSL
jgi:hypothetical protein